MKTRSIIKFTATLATAFTVFMTLSGCAFNRQPKAYLKVKTVSGDGIIIQSVNARQTDAGVMIFGTVRRTLGYGPIYRSHLDVEIVSPSGMAQITQPTRYIPNPIPNSRRFRRHADFAVELPVKPSRDNTIRVRHHATALQACPFFESPDHAL